MESQEVLVLHKRCTMQGRKVYIFSTILLLGILLFSCRKDELREIDDPGKPVPVHCGNDLWDVDELFVDCGGSCPDTCETVTVPCAPPDSSLVMTAGGPSEQYVLIECLESVNQFNISGTGATGGTIAVALAGGRPLNHRKYEIASSVDPSNPYSASLFIEQGTSGFAAVPGGTLFVTLVGDKIRVTFCDLSVTGTNSSYVGKATGKLTSCE